MTSTERLNKAIRAVGESHADKVPEVAELAAAAREFMQAVKSELLTPRLVFTLEELKELPHSTEMLGADGSRMRAGDMVADFQYDVKQGTNWADEYLPAATVVSPAMIRAAVKALEECHESQ